MFLKQLHIKNFKSYINQTVDFERVSVIVGANASGKSNFIDALRFINNIVIYGINDAISLSGGIEYLLNSLVGKSEPICFRFVMETDNNIEYEIERTFQLELVKIVYDFEIKAHKKGTGFNIIKDQLIATYEIFDSTKKKNKHKSIDVYYEKTTSGKIKQKISKECELSQNEKQRITLYSFMDFVNRTPEKKELVLHKIAYFIFYQFRIYDLIKIYDFDSKLLKLSSAISTKMELDEDGSNIALVLQKIIKNKSQRHKLINLLSDALPFVEDVNVKANYDKSIFYTIKENYSHKDFRANFLSDGTVNIIAIIIALYFEIEAGIVILEEPERNLHPKLMAKIIDMAKETSTNRQIIITTHTPELVKCIDMESVLYVERDTQGYSMIKRPSDSETIKMFLNNEIGMDDLFIQDMLGV